ncbi:unnamed protein product [Paramecium pentaurelia]|uniref:Tetratricopeptide repeat protein n=1 Tax=Paramecium pentaurelia TaxID=43138 RepID=A0A8S1V445_9CILI|nr:unnamed protein product [Paramecium pentaurelia]
MLKRDLLIQLSFKIFQQSYLDKLIQSTLYIMEIVQENQRNMKSLQKLMMQFYINNLKNADTSFGNGICLLYLNKPKEAENLLKNSFTLKSDCYLGYYGYGLQLFSQAQYQQAIKHCVKALDINPQHVYSLHGKGKFNSINQMQLPIYQTKFDLFNILDE